MKQPRGHAIHLVRHISDPGTRLDVEPTMRKITVDGVTYGKTSGHWIEYQDKKIGIVYVARVSVSEFMNREIE